MYKRGHKWNVVEDFEEASELSEDEDEDGSVAEDEEYPETIEKADFIENHVDALAYQERGNELPGVSNPLLVGSLFRLQSQPWENIASNHLDTVWKAVKQFLETLLEHLTDEKTCNQILIHVIDPAMETRHKLLKQKLEELLRPHRDYDPLSIDPLFARNIWSHRERRIAASIVETMSQGANSKGDAPLPSVEQIMAKIESATPVVGNKYGSLETFEFMQAYYEVSIRSLRLATHTYMDPANQLRPQF
jgi:hypothetical protein